MEAQKEQVTEEVKRCEGRGPMEDSGSLFVFVIICNVKWLTV